MQEDQRVGSTLNASEAEGCGFQNLHIIHQAPGCPERGPTVGLAPEVERIPTRTGRFEIWTTAAGTDAGQLTRDGMEAGSPAATRNGAGLSTRSRFRPTGPR